MEPLRSAWLVTAAASCTGDTQLGMHAGRAHAAGEEEWGAQPAPLDLAYPLLASISVVVLAQV